MSPRRLIDRPLASDRERRQAFLLAAVILLAVAGILVALRPSPNGHPSPAASVPASPALTTPATTPPSPTAPRSAAPSVVPPPAEARRQSRARVNRTQDAQNRDPRFRARLARELRIRPAFQHLPYHADGVVIDLVGTTPSGRLVLSVTYTGRRMGARRAYRRFLARYHDPGRAYHPRYQYRRSNRRHR